MKPNPEGFSPQPETTKKSSIYQSIIDEGPFPKFNPNEPRDVAQKKDAARLILRELDTLMNRPEFWKIESGKPVFHLDAGPAILEGIKQTSGRGLTREQENIIVAIMQLHGITSKERGVGNDLGAFSTRDKQGMDWAINAVKTHKPNSEYLNAFAVTPQFYLDRIMNTLEGKIT